MKYRHAISGTAADGQTWATDGEVGPYQEGEFVVAVVAAVSAAFQGLTQGKAVYGKPGLGCVGPYQITRMLIEEVQ